MVRWPGALDTQLVYFLFPVHEGEVKSGAAGSVRTLFFRAFAGTEVATHAVVRWFGARVAMAAEASELMHDAVHGRALMGAGTAVRAEPCTGPVERRPESPGFSRSVRRVPTWAFRELMRSNGGVVT